MNQVRAEIIAIGDELLYGHIVDTNSHWISEELSQKGVRVIRKTTVGDNRIDILSAFKEAEYRADFILITGGLGPTNDDLTKPLLAEYFNTEIIEFPEAVQAVTSFFKKRRASRAVFHPLKNPKYFLGALRAPHFQVPQNLAVAPPPRKLRGDGEWGGGGGGGPAAPRGGVGRPPSPNKHPLSF